ncbi:hypothetical protein Esti_003929 [Eimeria stiedai]
MAIREHLYLTLHGILGLVRGRHSAFKLPPTAAAGAAAAAERQQVLLEGPVVPYDFNWVSALRASRALRAAVQRSLQQQQQQQGYLEEQADVVRELLQQLRYSSLIKRSLLISHFGIKPLEALLDHLVSLQQQQQQAAAASSSCCRAPTAAELRNVEEASAALRRAVEQATTAPELIVPADCLEGEGARLLQHLFKETSSGGLRIPFRLQQQQQQRQQQPQQSRPTVDEWLAGALLAYGRGMNDLEAAQWFDEREVLERLPETLAAAYGLRLVPLLKQCWRGFGRRGLGFGRWSFVRRSLCGFPYRAQVYAVFDEEASNPRGFEQREQAGETHSDLLSPYKPWLALPWVLCGPPAFSFCGFLYFYPFSPLRLSHFFTLPKPQGFACHVKIKRGHHAVHALLQPPKFRQARLLDLQELTIIAHELGHAFKEMLQHNQEKLVTERPLDFDETFALINERILRRPEVLQKISKHKDTGRPLTATQAKSLGVDLVDLLHPNGPLVSAAIDFCIHTLDSFKASLETLETTIRQAVENVAPYTLDDSFPLFSLDYLRNIEGSYSGCLCCYVLAELRALRVLSQLEEASQNKQGAPLKGAPLPVDLRKLKSNLLPLHPTQRLPPLVGTAGGRAAVEALVRCYTKPKTTKALFGKG